jgi:hypothetical protein
MGLSVSDKKYFHGPKEIPIALKDAGNKNLKYCKGFDSGSIKNYDRFGLAGMARVVLPNQSGNCLPDGIFTAYLTCLAENALYIF